ncbi:MULTISPECIES: hypothetical protein [unclassified Streptomyces]|uniref:aldose epimerase family protein n=1 Tax=unclassified Streptomyces TaxID=2593676 RepID=UPI003423E105
MRRTEPDHRRAQPDTGAPNRIRDGRYRWNGQGLQLPLTEPVGGNAVHGLLRWTSWHVVEASDSLAVLDVSLWPQPGYPFHLHVRAEYAWARAGSRSPFTTPFGDLDRDADGRAVVRLAHPSSSFGTDVWLGEGAD